VANSSSVSGCLRRISFIAEATASSLPSEVISKSAGDAVVRRDGVEHTFFPGAGSSQTTLASQRGPLDRLPPELRGKAVKPLSGKSLPDGSR
jgi:hypothetical protein